MNEEVKILRYLLIKPNYAGPQNTAVQVVHSTNVGVLVT